MNTRLEEIVMKLPRLKSLPVSLGMMALALTTVPLAHADYASTIVCLGPVAYYRLDTTNLVPTELVCQE
ncbi:MAG: hypothetical protein NT154_24605 [Verrucomicrobia bacterium]|nr:hypothetical protein [Verrucomicrobiota bacterium]